MKTIAKNRRVAREIFEKATSCVCHDLQNCFVGSDCKPSVALHQLQDFGFAKLTADDEPGRFTVHVHGNEWYELQSPVEI